MSRLPPFRSPRLLGALAAAMLAPACASIDQPKVAVDYQAYEKIPILPTSLVYRRVLKAVPIVRGQVFYGRYGGFGNRGGRPVDALDDLFRKHDIVYYEANHYGAMVAADQALMQAVWDLDPDQLDRKGRRFREKTLVYFGSPSSLVVGKPVTSGWPRPERPTLFPTPETIRDFLTDPDTPFPLPPGPDTSDPEPTVSRGSATARSHR